MIYSFTAISFFLVSIYLWREHSWEKTRLAIFIALIWLVLYEGLRWEIGTDWEGYYDAFMYEDNVHMGITYNCLIYCFKSISDNYTFFIILLSTISYSALGWLLLHYSPIPYISLCIYFCGTLGIMGSNRQLLAIAVCILSLHFIFKRRFLYFLLTLLFASTIHITALSFIPAYFLLNVSYKRRTIIIIVGVVFIIGLLKLVNRIPFVDFLISIDSMQSGTGLASYVDYNPGLSVSLLGSIKRVIFIYLALMMKDVINDEKYNFFLLLYLLGCIIFLIFNGSVLQMVAGRGSAYYGIFECIVIAYIIYYAPVDFFRKELLWTLFFIFYFCMMWRDIHNYIILEGVDIFNPYKSVLFK